MRNMKRQFIDKIRLHELDLVLAVIAGRKPRGSKILEIGSGTGLQAMELAQHGYTVEAVDLETSNYLSSRIWPIINYDGNTIPFDDNHFDVVYSSSVLEHIPHIKEFQQEIIRVLKPNGVAIHVVPGGWWAFWTAVTHYPFIIKTIVRTLSASVVSAENDKNTSKVNPEVAPQADRQSGRNLLRRVILPSRHGERGNWLTEIYIFSRKVWATFFVESGWKVDKYISNGLFYSGNLIFDSLISIRARRLLSYILGSVCHIFVLVKED